MTFSSATELECRSLRVCTGQRTILEEVSFTIRSGESLMVIGPNGSGKTTLLHALLGLTPAAAGEILWNGRRIQRQTRSEMARMAAYVPQLPEMPHGFTVFEYVLTARYARRRTWRGYSAEDQRSADTALALTGMADFSDRPVATLSGGELQKVLLAAAVAQEPPFLLLDEPAAFLDYHHQVEIMALIERLRQERNLSVILVTHDLNIPFLAGARLLALKNGRPLFYGAAADLPRQLAMLEQLYDTPFRVITSQTEGWFIQPVFTGPGGRTP